MGVQITGGTGRGYVAKVDEFNRISVKSDIATESEFFTDRGRGFNINPGTITLTSANKSSLLYLKNNADEVLVIDSVIYLLGNTTNASTTADTLVEIERNPTSGTLISAASTVTPSNRNFSSGITLSADVYKGAEGSTITSGCVSISSLFASAGRYALPVGLLMGVGSTISISVTPKTDNTNMDVQIAMSVYLKK